MLSRLPQYNEQIKNKIDNIYKSEEKVAYLTFDDGPSKDVTNSILNTLKKENVKATFFVLGSRVELYPELVKREYEEGHFIANHGYSHKYSSIYKSPNAVLEEYQKTNNAVKKAIGVSQYDSHLFRFPGGSVGGKYSKVKKKAVDLLQKNNIAHVNWNALTEDSVGHPSKKKMMKTLKQTIGDKKSIVILMHDAGNKQKTAEMLPDIIKYLKEKGYSFKNFYDIMK